MSQTATNRQKRRADVIRRLSVLKPGQHDVLVLRLPAHYFASDEAMGAANGIAQEIGRQARRPVFILKEGEELTAENMQALVEAIQARMAQPPAQVVVPKARIHLPTGIRADGI